MSPLRLTLVVIALSLSAGALAAQASPRAQRAMMQDTTMMPCPKPAPRDTATARGGAMGGNMAAPGGAMGGNMAAPGGAMARPAADSAKKPCTPAPGTTDRGGQMKKPDAMGRPPRR